MIRKIALRNYRLFKEFDLDFTPGLNILVGSNESGKSTLIEAVSLGLTNRINGRPFSQELTPYFINVDATRAYLADLKAKKKTPPPTLIIDIFLEANEETEILRGTNNVHAEDACGVRIQAKLSQDFDAEYNAFIGDVAALQLAPTEYYRVEWLGFSGNPVTARSVPATASVVDPSSVRLQAGVDHHLQQILRTQLDPNERVELSRQYRSLREEFSQKEAVKAINTHLQKESESLTNRKLSLAVDISQRYTWENGLVAHLDDLPFHFASKGEQSALKTVLAIGRKSKGAQVVLIEEPEAHLSFAHLQMLMKRIVNHCEGKQVIVATHSNYVLNKLGLENMILLGDKAAMRFQDLPDATQKYFQKLPGFDTLRMVLAKKAILVEGPSDELIVQRAYLDAKGKLPIEDGIDVISVGLSHKRFLDLAVRLKRKVAAVTDNDGKPPEHHIERFAEYLATDYVTIHYGVNPEVKTLEPQIVEVNDIATLNDVLGKKCSTKQDLIKVMTAEKTDSALAIFESKTKIVMPQYILDAISAF